MNESTLLLPSNDHPAAAAAVADGDDDDSNNEGRHGSSRSALRSLWAIAIGQRGRELIEEEDEAATDDEADDDGDDDNERVRRRARVAIDDETQQYLALEERNLKLASLFGLKPTAATVSRDVRRRTRRLHRANRTHPTLPRAALFTIDNMLYAAVVGAPLAVAYLLASALLALTFVGWPYARLFFEMARYVAWPFGSYLTVSSSASLDAAPSPMARLAAPFLLVAFALLAAAHAAAFVLLWSSIAFIPAAKVVRDALWLAARHGAALRVRTSSVTSDKILLAAYYGANVHYFKYSVFDGFNVCMTNLSCLSVFVVAFGLGAHWAPSLVPALPPLLLFVLSLVSMVPLAYFVGLAIARISVQSTPAVAACLNATFGSLVDLILLGSAIYQGGLDVLVKSTLVGSLLLCLLLFPGLAMIAGGLRYAQQSFNALAAGVSAELLLLSIVGAFTPTIFYATYGAYSLTCTDVDVSAVAAGNATTLHEQCYWSQPAAMHASDPVYRSMARPIMYASAVILPLAYLIGLLYTLKTHAKLIYEDTTDARAHGQIQQADAANGAAGAKTTTTTTTTTVAATATTTTHKSAHHAAPKWSRLKATLVLIGSTVLFGLVAEVLVQTVQASIDTLGLSQRFVGMTIVAAAPAASELFSAVKFALRDNISLSFEVASSYSVQIALIQMPALVLYSALLVWLDTTRTAHHGEFTLLFSQLDVFAVILSVLVVNYVVGGGTRTNYLEGFLFVMIWCIFMVAYYFAPSEM